MSLPKAKTQEEIQLELEEILTYQTVSLPTRMLRKNSLEQFNVKVALSEEDGKTPSATYFPMTKKGEVTGYYVKTLGDKKYQWSIGDVRDAEPFNWINAKNSGAWGIIITEGREDAVAVHQILEKHSGKVTEKVIALPNGVNSVKKSLGPIVEDLKQFKSIKLCFDGDEAGQRAVEEAMLLLPMAKVITLPCKDPNDCILQGRTEEAFQQIYYRAKTPKNTRLIAAEDLFEAAREPTPYGDLTWPWSKLNKLLRGVRYGETIYVGAGVKMGKSDIADEIAKHFIEHHKVPVFMAKPEENNKKTLKLIAGKLVGHNFVDPDITFDYEAFDKACELTREKLYLVNLYQHLGWETLRQDIVFAATNLGVKAVFIDPITNLTNGEEASDANTKLSGIAQDLASMAHDLNIVIFIFCHLKAPEGNIPKEQRERRYKKGQYIGLGNCPHEFGGSVLSNQFAGSRAMMRSCNLMLGLEGNKDPDLREIDENLPNMRWLTILEDREFGNSDKVALYRNPITTQYKEA